MRLLSPLPSPPPLPPPLSCVRVIVYRLCHRLEHGTVSYQSIAAIPSGFDVFFSLVKSMKAVQEHTFTLAQYTYQQLSQLRHVNNQPMVEIYAASSYESSADQGPVVTFNLLHPDGSYVGYSQVR